MRAVIFDFDGTLADSFTAIIGIAHKLTKHQQLADPDYVKSMRDQNVGLKQAIRMLEIHKWQWPWLIKRGRKIMKHQIDRIPVIEGMDEVLRQLSSEGFEMFIISSNTKPNIDRFLVEKGLLPYFKNVYGSVGLFNKAKVLKRVLKKQGFDKDSAIYVGDEVRDVEAAKAIDMPCIAVTWGFNSEALLVREQPMVVVRTPKQLAKVITEWGSTL